MSSKHEYKSSYGILLVTCRCKHALHELEWSEAEVKGFKTTHSESYASLATARFLWVLANQPVETGYCTRRI